MGLLNSSIKRLMIALSGKTNGLNVAGAIGLYGGGRITASAATVLSSVGDVNIAADSGGAPCTYRITFPNANANIASLDWIEVKGFTPRNPSAVETLDCLVTGYNYDSSLKQWYVTVQIVTYGTGAAVSAVTAAGYVIGIRAAVTYNPSGPTFTL